MTVAYFLGHPVIVVNLVSEAAFEILQSYDECLCCACRQ